MAGFRNQSAAKNKLSTVADLKVNRGLPTVFSIISTPLKFHSPHFYDTKNANFNPLIFELGLIHQTK